MNYKRIPYRWSSGPFSEEVLERMNTILSAWRGTPYMDGQCTIGVGVDCVRWVCHGVLDALSGYRRTIPHAPADVPTHSLKEAQANLQMVIDMYDAEVLESDVVEPGDILAVGPSLGGPGHAMIVGSLPQELWQCTVGAGVQRCGFTLPETYRVYGAYRYPKRLEEWTIPAFSV